MLNVFLRLNSGAIPGWWWLPDASASCAALANGATPREAYDFAIYSDRPSTCRDFDHTAAQTVWVPAEEWGFTCEAG